MSSNKPFIQVHLDKVPPSLTKVTFHHQCYKLVPDLSPEDEAQKELVIHSDTPDKKFKDVQNINEGPRKRRQLPSIPADRKPFQKLWEIEQKRRRQPLSMELDNSLNWKPNASTPKEACHRWTRKLSTNMLLEIETDPSNGKALSLRLLNEDEHPERAKSELMSPEIHYGTSCSFEQPLCVSLDSPEHSSVPSQLNSGLTNTSDDSGLCSTLQSPVTSNSDSNESAESRVKHRTLQLPEATHRALYKFCARHSDEINLEIGDAIYVYEEFEDQWSEGMNLRTEARGIFPSALVTDVEYSEFTIESNNFAHTLPELGTPPINFRIKRERYLLNFLGSIEVSEAKGDEVLEESISRVSSEATPNKIGMQVPYQCLLEISDIGIRMMDDPRQSRPIKTAVNTKIARHDYFFSLVQITYCGYKLKNDSYYFAFITRHPSKRTRFACHVFQAGDNTRDVAEAVGRAFQRFYNRFLEITMPVDTI